MYGVCERLFVWRVSVSVLCVSVRFGVDCCLVWKWMCLVGRVAGVSRVVACGWWVLWGRRVSVLWEF